MAMMRRTLRRAKCYVCLVIIVGQTRPSAYARFLGFQNNTYLYRWTDLNRMTSVSLWLLLFFCFYTVWYKRADENKPELFVVANPNFSSSCFLLIECFMSSCFNPFTTLSYAHTNTVSLPAHVIPDVSCQSFIKFNKSNLITFSPFHLKQSRLWQNLQQ